MVHPPARHIADHYPADVQFLPGALSPVDIAGENTGLEPEDRIVYLGQGRVKIAKGGEHGHRAKSLPAGQVLLRGDLLEQGGLQHAPLAFSPAEQGGPGRHGRLDPGLQARGFFLGDHRPDKRFGILGIPCLECPGRGHQLFLERRVQRCMDEDALNPDATLA